MSTDTRPTPAQQSTAAATDVAEFITGDKPALVLRVVKREQHDEEMAQELAQLVRVALDGSGVPVLVGSYSLKG